MARSEAMIGYGTTWQMAKVSTPDVFVSLSEIFSVTSPVETSPTVDVTHMQSPNRQTESIAAMGTTAEATVEGNFIPDSITDRILNDAQTAGRFKVIITYPNGAGKMFFAERSSYSQTTPVADKMTFSAAFAASGGVTPIPVSAPKNLVVPVLMNAAVAPKVGGIIELEDGDWSGASSRVFSWESGATAAGSFTPIAGATGAVYVPKAADVGKFIRGKVTASNKQFSLAVNTAATLAVVA